MRLETPDHSVELTTIPTAEKGQKRRIYRSHDGGHYFLVGEITNDTTTTHTDNRRVDWGWGTRLEGLGTDWNFKDNWVNSLTIGSAAFIALLTASDVLKAVLGSENESAVGLFAVTAGAAAVFVSISPLLIKLIGEDISLPTIGGTLVAAAVTLVGAIGQITAITWQGAKLVSVEWVSVMIVILGFSIGQEVEYECKQREGKKRPQIPDEHA